MNSVNSIRADNYSIKHRLDTFRKRIGPVSESGTATNKRNQLKTKVENDFCGFNSNQQHPDSLIANKKYYQSELLTEIYNKMSGAENDFSLGYFIEYYA